MAVPPADMAARSGTEHGACPGAITVDPSRLRPAAAMAHRLRWRAPHPATGTQPGARRDTAPVSEDATWRRIVVTVAFVDTPLPAMGAMAEAWDIHGLLPQR